MTSPPPSDRRARIIAVTSVLAGLLVLVLHALEYERFITDDAYISLRYAQRLLAGEGLTWTAGEAVEGYSNLLWVLGCALLGALGLDLVVAARILGLLGTASALIAVGVLFRPAREPSRLPALAAMLALAVSGPLAVWSMGGLEQALMAGLVAWSYVFTVRVLEGVGSDWKSAVPAGVVFGLLCLARPDAPLFGAAAVVVVVAQHGVRGGRWRSSMTLVAIVGVFVATQLAFRLIYYDDWLPNTAYAKVALSEQRLRDGLAYLRGSMIALAGVLVPAALALVVTWRHPIERGRVALAWLAILFWSGYLLLIGGDFFPGRRQMVPVVVLAALASGHLWARLGRAHRRWVRRSAWPLAAVTVAWLAAAQRPTEEQNARALADTWPRDGESVGELLATAFGDREPLLAVEAAGSLPYWAGTPSLDMLGLNDRQLAHARPADIGQGVLGHELGDGAYVLSREPDLVVFCNAKGRRDPCYRGARELYESAEFRRRYKLVHFRTRSPQRIKARIWLRMDSDKVGVGRAADHTWLPAHLFARDDALAFLDADSRLTVDLDAKRKLVFGSLELAPGRYRARVDADAEVQLEVAIARGGGPLLVGDGQGTFVVSSPPERLRVAVASQATRAHLHGIDFERVGD